jgi:hypothetical protein
MTSPDQELDVEATARMLDSSVVLVIRRMDDGRLSFRQDGDRRLAKLEDVMKLKVILQEQEKLLRELADMQEVDVQPELRL